MISSFMKSSYSMSGRTELTTFLKLNWCLFVYKNSEFSKMRHNIDTKRENHYNRKTSEKQFCEIESS